MGSKTILLSVSRTCKTAAAWIGSFIKRYIPLVTILAIASSAWLWQKNQQLDTQNRILFKEKCVQMGQPKTPAQKEEIEKTCAAMIHYSSLEKVSPYLVLAVAVRESGLNPTAVGYRQDGRGCDYGIMQINTCAHDVDTFSCDVLRSVACNIHHGIKMLAEELRFFKGNEKLALLAYNRGRGAVLADVRIGANPSNGYEKTIFRYRDRIIKYSV